MVYVWLPSGWVDVVWTLPEESTRSCTLVVRPLIVEIECDSDTHCLPLPTILAECEEVEGYEADRPPSLVPCEWKWLPPIIGGMNGLRGKTSCKGPPLIPKLGSNGMNGPPTIGNEKVAGVKGS